MKNLVLLAIILINVTGKENHSFLLADDVSNLLQKSRDHFFYDSADIPATVYYKMHKLTESRFEIVNPNKDFRRTDKITNSNLASRRLIFGVKDEDRYLFCYENGGRGYGVYLVYTELKRNGKVKCIYSIGGILPKKRDLNNIEFYLAEIKKGDYLLLYDNGKKTEREYVKF